MSTLHSLFLGILAQFLAGWAQLTTSDGKVRFWALFWRNFAVQLFFFFYLSLIPSLIVLLFGHQSDRPQLYQAIGSCLLFIVAYSLLRAIFDIPNAAIEKGRLDGYVRALNPLHVLIIIPMCWARSVLARRRTP